MQCNADVIHAILAYCFMSTVNSDQLLRSLTVFAYYTVGKYAILDAAEISCGAIVVQKLHTSRLTVN